MVNEYLLRKRLHKSWVPGPTKNKKKKEIKSTSGRQRCAREIRYQKEEQRVKKKSGPQRGYPVLKNSLPRGTPLPPHR